MKKIRELQDELEFLMNKKPRKAKIELRIGKSDPSEKEIKLKFKEINNERFFTLRITCFWKKLINHPLI